MDSQIDKVKEATSIVEIIGERLVLQKSGGYYKALCPFHHEKSPSFFINEQLGRFKCFGCGESGDVFNFLQKYDNLTFYESLKYLADKANINLKNYQKDPQDNKREKLLEILSLAADYYHYLLVKHKIGIGALEYLKKRSINNQSIKLFNLGYAPLMWDGLISFLHKKKKYVLDDLVMSGLAIKSQNGRIYDRFRHRVMFPLRNHLGQIVGFSGRLIKESSKEGKYINTNETPLYHKSKMLFGYYELLNEIRQKKEVLICEGEFDVISSAQIGINNIVAIKGSAFSLEQAKILKRVVERVILCLDNDSAGLQATQRAIKILQSLDFEIKILPIEGGKDPDELSRHNPNLFRKMIKNHLSLYDFLIQLALKQHDTKTIEGKKNIIIFLSTWFQEIKNVVEYDFYLEKLASLLEVKINSLKTDLKRASMGHKIDQEKPIIDNQKKNSTSKREKLETYLLNLTLHCEYKDLKTKIKSLVIFEWQKPEIKLIIDNLSNYLDCHKEFVLKLFNQQLSEDLQVFLSLVLFDKKYLFIFDQEKFDLDKEWRQIYWELKRAILSLSVNLLKEKITLLDQKQNKDLKQEKELNVLLQQLKQKLKKRNFVLK